VLIRFIDLARADVVAEDEVAEAAQIEPIVHGLLASLGQQFRSGTRVEQEPVREAARGIVAAVESGRHIVRLRVWDEGPRDLAGHTANVAIMTAAMSAEAGFSHTTRVDVTAAALLHDAGHLLLPEQIQGVPEPALDERAKRYVRHHAFLGARALLEGGCPPLWVATALDHHRGIDAQGYPVGHAIPHTLTRLVSVANYVERKRVPLGEGAVVPEDAIRGAMSLAGKYFDPAWVRVLLSALGVFPPGMVVELTNGQPAVVTRVNSRDPLRPEVQLLLGDDAGKKCDLMKFNVLERRYELSIVRALPPVRPQKKVAAWTHED
jgi:HD-GYP domain-containing protein (c-di-GMP phosphodiesterase class II)